MFWSCPECSEDLRDVGVMIQTRAYRRQSLRQLPDSKWTSGTVEWLHDRHSEDEEYLCAACEEEITQEQEDEINRLYTLLPPPYKEKP